MLGVAGMGKVKVNTKQQKIAISTLLQKLILKLIAKKQKTMLNRNLGG